MLQASGFQVAEIALIPGPTLLSAGIAAWLRTFRSALLASIDAIDQEAVIEQVSCLLKPVMCTRTGDWCADCVRLRFAAHVA